VQLHNLRSQSFLGRTHGRSPSACCDTIAKANTTSKRYIKLTFKNRFEHLWIFSVYQKGRDDEQQVVW